MSAAPTALSILVVEADATAARRISEALRSTGLLGHLHGAADAAAAADYISGAGPFADRTAHPFPGLVLLDLHAKGRPPLDFLRWLRSHAAFCRLPVVGLAASPDDEALRLAYETGANSCLVKSPDPEELRRMMQLLAGYWGRLNLPPAGP